MDGGAIRTVLVALILAILIVPFDGAGTLPALLVVAAIAAFDLWRQAKRREQIAAGATSTASRVHEPALEEILATGRCDVVRDLGSIAFDGAGMFAPDPGYAG